MRRALLVVFFLAPTAAASAEGLSATSAGWQGGLVEESRFIALRHLDGLGSFALAAAQLNVRTVVADVYVNPGPAWYAPDWRFEDAEFSGATLAGTVARQDAFLFVVPVEGQPLPSVATGCGNDLVAADEGKPRQVPSPIEQPNPNPQWAVGQAVSFTPCDALEICGAFTVSLWDRDASGASDQGPLELQSGQLARPGEPDARPALGRAQQLYLTTTDGCFTMEPDESTALVVETLGLGQAAALALRGAHGTVGGTDVPFGSSLRLAGSLSLRLGRGTDGVDVIGLSGIESGQLNGQPLALATVAPGGAGADWTPAPWLPVLPAVAALALWLRRRGNSPERLLDRLYAASEQDPGKVVQVATRLLQRDSYPLEAHAARAAASLELDQFEQALADCKAALGLVGFRRPSQRASIATLACRAASLLGRTDEAVQWLGEVYTNDLHAAQDAIQYPEVRRLLPSTPGYS